MKQVCTFLLFLTLTMLSGCSFLGPYTLEPHQPVHKSLESTSEVSRIQPIRIAAIKSTAKLPDLSPINKNVAAWVNPKHVECMATTMYFEAKSEPRAGIIAVGQVILNRTKDPRFPSDICGVVHQKTVSAKTKKTQCQFSWYCDNLSDTPKNTALYLKIREMAVELLKGDAVNTVQDSLYFRASYLQKKTPAVAVARIGGHFFYASYWGHKTPVRKRNA